jgi:hypothetical protein
MENDRLSEDGERVTVPVTIPVALARIETKLDAMTARDLDHESRIRSLERALWLGIGFAAAIGSATGSLAAKLISG